LAPKQQEAAEQNSNMEQIKTAPFYQSEHDWLLEAMHLIAEGNHIVISDFFIGLLPD